MKNTILIHGYAGKDLSFWLQWLEKELSKHSHVFFPSYVDSKISDMEKWTSLFNKKLSRRIENYNFIAHSLGSLVTMKLIEQHDIKVQNMVLVACPVNKIELHRQLIDRIDDDAKMVFTKFVEHEYDWDLIKK